MVIILRGFFCCNGFVYSYSFKMVYLRHLGSGLHLKPYLKNTKKLIVSTVFKEFTNKQNAFPWIFSHDVMDYLLYSVGGVLPFFL